MSVSLKNLQRLVRQGTEGPWEPDGLHNLVICGGNPPKKALHEFKVKICEVPMTDQVTGLLNPKERDANVQRIKQLPELEQKFLEAVELIKSFDDGDNEKVTEFLKSVS